MFGDEPLFGAPVAEYAGQALGVVVLILHIFNISKKIDCKIP